MPEAEVKNAEATPKPKCLRCGAEHTVSNLNHWTKGWWTCAICNIRWEEDIFDQSREFSTFLALLNTSSNIFSVSLPVCVFCWLG